MAGSRIATCLHENGHGVEVEAYRPFGRSTLDFDRDDFGFTFKGDLELGFAVLEWMENHIFPLDNPRLAEGKGGFPRGVPRGVVIVFGLDHDGVEIFFGLQANGWRISFELYKFFAAGLLSQSQGAFRLGMQLIAARPICAGLDPTGENVLLGFGKGAFGGMISSSAAGRLTRSRRRLLAKSLATSEGPESPPFFAK